jgi:hypothetical protein
MPTATSGARIDFFFAFRGCLYPLKDLYLFCFGVWCRNKHKQTWICWGSLRSLVLICEVDCFESVSFLKVYPSHPPIFPILGRTLVFAHPRTFFKRYQGPDQSSRQAVKYKNPPSRHFQKSCSVLYYFLSFQKFLLPAGFELESTVRNLNTLEGIRGIDMANVAILST